MAVKGCVAVEAGVEDGELGPHHEVQVAHLVIVRAARTDAVSQACGLEVAGGSQLITCTSSRPGPASLLVATATGAYSNSGHDSCCCKGAPLSLLKEEEVHLARR